jgi:hypothetical protein
MDPWVVLKKKHLDTLCSSRLSNSEGAVSSGSNMSQQTGQQWYVQSANRAVNQVHDTIEKLQD